MPFNVEPSKSVVVDTSDANPDDVLCVTNEDGSCLFLSFHKNEIRFPWYAITSGLEPSYIREAAMKAARGWLRHISHHEYSGLRNWLEQQQSDDLVAEIAGFMLQEHVVRTEGGSLDIGNTMTVVFPRDIAKIYARMDHDGAWTSPSPISSIKPIDPFDAKVRFALGGGLPRQHSSADGQSR